MSEISYETIASLAEAAELQRMEGMDVTYSDGETSTTHHYWQAFIGDPLDSTIQIDGEDEDEARVNLGKAAWAIIQARQESTEAAATPVGNPQGYSEEQMTGFTDKQLEADYPPEA